MATYRESGVDLDAAEELVARIKPAVTKTWHAGITGGFGGFAAGISIPPGYADPVLMMSTDGIGTKAQLATQADLLDGLGWDLVAMCIDDLVATGARPFAMNDYIAIGRLDLSRVERIVRSIAAACAAADVALLGGETAEHPGVMGADEFDLAGTAIGIVDRGNEIDGTFIAPGDVIIGVDSPNIRANGFSLVRSVLGAAASAGPLVEELLAPSVLYTPDIMRLLEQLPVTGLAHITGGGLPGNVGRILPSGCDAVIDRSSWDVPDVFSEIGSAGAIDRDELFRTFNMGIGFVAVVNAEHAGAAAGVLSARGRDARVIGEITSGSGGVRLSRV